MKWLGYCKIRSFPLELQIKMTDNIFKLYGITKSLILGENEEVEN